MSASRLMPLHSLCVRCSLRRARLYTTASDAPNSLTRPESVLNRSSTVPLPRSAAPASHSSQTSRWKSTPRLLSVPFRLRRGLHNPDIRCNDDPNKLDIMYRQVFGLFGPGATNGRQVDGSQFLSEETKWLAVTHKSFDQGKRGFNERLSLLGRRLVEAEASIDLLGELSSKAALAEVDEYGRQPFSHPQLKGVEHLDRQALSATLSTWKLFNLADSYGIPQVLRWKPKNSFDPEASGLQIITVQSLYAIVGALALERGGIEAKFFIQHRILKALKLIQ